VSPFWPPPVSAHAERSYQVALKARRQAEVAAIDAERAYRVACLYHATSEADLDAAALAKTEPNRIITEAAAARAAEAETVRVAEAPAESYRARRPGPKPSCKRTLPPLRPMPRAPRCGATCRSRQSE
jgi:hypothetical protein